MGLLAPVQKLGDEGRDSTFPYPTPKPNQSIRSIQGRARHPLPPGSVAPGNAFWSAYAIGRSATHPVPRVSESARRRTRATFTSEKAEVTSNRRMVPRLFGFFVRGQRKCGFWVKGGRRTQRSRSKGAACVCISYRERERGSPGLSVHPLDGPATVNGTASTPEPSANASTAPPQATGRAPQDWAWLVKSHPQKVELHSRSFKGVLSMEVISTPPSSSSSSSSSCDSEVVHWGYPLNTIHSSSTARSKNSATGSLCNSARAKKN